MRTFSQNLDECKVMNNSITSYWLDACSEMYKEILFDRHYKYDIIIKTKLAPKYEKKLVNNDNDDDEKRRKMQKM